MEENREEQHVKQETSQGVQPKASKENAVDAPDTTSQEATRPRHIPEEQRAVETGVERRQARQTRELRSRTLGDAPERPQASQPGMISQHQTRSIDSAPPAAPSEPVSPQKNNTMETLTDLGTVKWSAWAALLISVLALGLVGLYSQKTFSPQFEYHNLAINQQKILNDLEDLQNITYFEKIKSAVLSAHIQILLREDYEAAADILSAARQQLGELIQGWSPEQSAQPKKVISAIDAALREIRKPPLDVDEKIRIILLQLDKI